MKKIDGSKIIKQYSKEEIPFIILVYVVDKCNYQCSYCYNKFPRTLQMIDVDNLLKFIKNVKKQLPFRPIQISLIGGEPSLYDKLNYLCVELVKDDRIKVELITNFSKPLDFYINLMNMGVDISASWHSKIEDKKNCDYIEKMLMLPEKYIDNIDVRIMFEPDNWENSKNVFFSLFKKFKKSVEIYLLTDDFGCVKKYSDKQISEFNNLLFLRRIRGKEYTVQYDDGTEEDVTADDIDLNSSINFKGWKCKACLDSLYIHSNGDVYNCQSYYTSGMERLFNINETNGGLGTFEFQPCICKVNHCLDFDITKYKISTIN